MQNYSAISMEDFNRVQEDFQKCRGNLVAKNAVANQGIGAVARVPERAALAGTVFDVEVKQGKVCNQERSGRCWMFASLNTMRMRIMKKYDLKNFELSQAYPLYWDKAEKSNWFLENILDTLNEPADGRLVSFLLKSPVGDGGAWDMFKALVAKYGVVPKEAMPETACSRNTTDMNRYLTRYLRSCACKLREAHAAGAGIEELRESKQEMMDKVLKLLTICLGKPPLSFHVRARNKDDELVLNGQFSPQQFFAQAVDMNLDDFISVVSAPTADKPFMRTYTVARLGNVVEAGGVRYLNLESDQLKELAIAQLKDDVPVWFGCDVAQQFLREDGIMDLDALAIDKLFGFEIEAGFSKAQRLDYGESLMTHAMVLEGVNFDEQGKPSLWKVENSWGEDHGRNGFDALADSWFDEYVYQVIIDRKYLSEEQRRVFDEMEPIELAPWDPLGALA